MSAHGGEDPDAPSLRPSGQEQPVQRPWTAASEQPNNDPPTVELGLPREQSAEEGQDSVSDQIEADRQQQASEQQAAQLRSDEQDPETWAEESAQRERQAPFEQPRHEPAFEASRSAPEADAGTEREQQSRGTWADPPAPPARLPDTNAVQSNGSGPPANVSPSGALALGSWWQRPESTLAAAFLAGVLIAGLLKRRRSQ